jgi:hypothetical protein
MDIIIDFVLLAVSGVAAFYCAVLHRRLGRLMDAERGIGVAIASMSATLDQTKQILIVAQENCRRSAEELAPLIDEARRLSDKLTEATDIASEMTVLALGDIEKAAATGEERVKRALETPRTLPKRPADFGAGLQRALKSRGLEHLLG